MIYGEMLNSDVFIKFLNQLVKDAKRKIYLIIDNLRVRNSSPVRQWIEEHEDKIKLHYLAPFSHERNPDEYLNGDLKSALGKLLPPSDKEKLESNVIKKDATIREFPSTYGFIFQPQMSHLCPGNIIASTKSLE